MNKNTEKDFRSPVFVAPELKNTQSSRERSRAKDYVYLIDKYINRKNFVLIKMDTYTERINGCSDQRRCTFLDMIFWSFSTF